MIALTPTISIREDEIKMDFVRSSGPGGQNVNKVSTAVQLRFDVLNCLSLNPEVKERLIRLAGSKMTDEGILIIKAQRFRSQEKNRTDALDRLILLVEAAATIPKTRRKTKPSRNSKEKRLLSKKKRSTTKKLRRFVSDKDE